MRYLLLGIVMLIGISCRGTSIAKQAHVRPVATADLVYGALLDSLFRGQLPDTLVVRESTLVYTGPGRVTVEQWQREYDEFPADLVARLIQVSVPRRSAAALGITFRPTRLFTIADRATIAGKNPEDFWSNFRQRFSNAPGILGLSPIAFTPDSSEALFYYDYSCGSRCGQGDLVWLAVAPDRRWLVRKILNFRIS